MKKKHRLKLKGRVKTICMRCPNGHNIFGLAMPPDEAKAEEMLNALIEYALRLHAINPICEICRAPRERWGPVIVYFKNVAEFEAMQQREADNRMLTIGKTLPDADDIMREMGLIP
jgi:hypothetical protein